MLLFTAAIFKIKIKIFNAVLAYVNEDIEICHLNPKNELITYAEICDLYIDHSA